MKWWKYIVPGRKRSPETVEAQRRLAETQADDAKVADLERRLTRVTRGNHLAADVMKALGVHRP